MKSNADSEFYDLSVDGIAVDVDETQTPEVSQQLADMFDRYSAALDQGDDQAAESVLAEQPGIGEEYRMSMRGLYLLGLAADEQRREKVRADKTDSTALPSAPKRIGDFEIQYELGRGGMGIVYAANQISLQRQVALKVLPFAAVLDPRQVTRFRNEARSAASLHHPNIVPVYGVGCERGVHFYSMQLVHGQTLAQLIEQLVDRASLDENIVSPDTETESIGNLNTARSIKSGGYVKSIIELGIKVAEAINFAHEEGIVHRDIKPSNLLLDGAGKVWVADFGLARGREPSNLTTQGGQLGTLRYMSPEQASGRHHAVDYRTDIYSLGITLCEMLTLKPVFDHSDKLKLMAAIESSEPLRLRAANRAVSKDLETVLNKAIAKSPADRYHSAQKFADDLQRCLSGKPIVAKPKSILDRCVDSAGRHKKIVGIAACGLMLLSVAAICVASVFYQQQQRERQSAENARVFLKQAHKSVDRFGVLLVDELSNGPVTDSFKASLLGEAAGYYDDFLAFSQNDPQLNFERAQALSQCAGVYERIGNDTIAKSRYQQAITAFGRTREDSAATYQQLICLNRLGMLHKRCGDFLAARSSYEKAIIGFAGLEVARRKRPEVLVAEAQTHSNLALLMWAQGDEAATDTSFENAMQILGPVEVLANLSGDKAPLAELRSTRLRVSANYVSLLAELDVDRAGKVLRQTIEDLESVLDERNGISNDELKSESVRALADMRNNLAVMLSKQGRLKEAVELANQVVEFWQEEIERLEDPLDVDALNHLATAWNTKGEIHWRLKDDKLADAAFVEAERLLRQVAQGKPRRPEVLSRLGGVLHNRSLVDHRIGDSESAAGQIDEAIVFQSRAVKISPSNKRYAQLLATHRRALAVFLEDRHE